MEFVFGLLIVALPFVVVAIFRRKNREALTGAAAHLGLENATCDAENIAGDLRGKRVHAQYVPRGGYAPPHMAIEVKFSPCALALELRQATSGEARDVSAGRAVDLRTGDAAFDDAYVVEGAPPGRALQLLADPELRDRLGRFLVGSPWRGDGPRVTIEDGVVSMVRDGTDFTPRGFDETNLRLAIDLAERAATVSQTASGDADAAVTYRVAGPSGADASGADRIRALKEMRALRRFRYGRPRLVLGAAVLPALTIYSVATVASTGTTPLAEHVAYLAAFVVPLHAVATGFGFSFLRGVRKTCPGIALDAVSLAALGASWLLVAGALALGTWL